MHDKDHFQRKLVIIFQKSNQLGLIVIVYLHSFCHLDLDIYLSIRKLRLVVFLEEFECSELCFPRPKRGTGQGALGEHGCFCRGVFHWLFGDILLP